MKEVYYGTVNIGKDVMVSGRVDVYLRDKNRVITQKEMFTDFDGKRVKITIQTIQEETQEDFLMSKIQSLVGATA